MQRKNTGLRKQVTRQGSVMAGGASATRRKEPNFGSSGSPPEGLPLRLSGHLGVTGCYYTPPLIDG